MGAPEGPRRRSARAEYVLPPDAASAARARRLAGAFLRGRRRHSALAGARTDDAVLIVSELVANAVEHGRSRCRLRLMVQGRRVTVEVGDQNSALPHRPAADADAERGRGLALVYGLAQRVDMTAAATGGKTVRAVLSG